MQGLTGAAREGTLQRREFVLGLDEPVRGPDVHALGIQRAHGPVTGQPRNVLRQELGTVYRHSRGHAPDERPLLPVYPLAVWL